MGDIPEIYRFPAQRFRWEPSWHPWRLLARPGLTRWLVSGLIILAGFMAV